VLTFDNKTVILPNSKVSNEVIVNLSREGHRRIDVELKFPYKVSFEHVKDVVNETIDKSDAFLSDPPLRMGVEALEDDGYKVKINIWVSAHGFNDTRMAFQEALMTQLQASEAKLPGMQV
jgi:small conductance mechanosensitive channel